MAYREGETVDIPFTLSMPAGETLTGATNTNMVFWEPQSKTRVVIAFSVVDANTGEVMVTPTGTEFTSGDWEVQAQYTRGDGRQRRTTPGIFKVGKSLPTS